MKSITKRGAKKANSGIKNLKPIQKGQVLNPNGRPKLPEEVRAMKEASTQQLIESYHKFAFADIQEITKVQPDNLVEMGVKQTLSNFANSGEVDHISKLWDRVLGKPLESIDVTSRGEKMNFSGEKLTPEERRNILKRLREEMDTNNG
jgi:hypothetical protein